MMKNQVAVRVRVNVRGEEKGCEFGGWGGGGAAA